MRSKLDPALIDALRELHVEADQVGLDDEILRDLKRLPRLLAKLKGELDDPETATPANDAGGARPRRKSRSPKVTAPS